MNDPSGLASVAILLACTLASLAFTAFWALANRRPEAVRVHLTGRRASPYWYSPTGLQDERGLSARTMSPVSTAKVAPTAS